MFQRTLSKQEAETDKLLETYTDLQNELEIILIGNPLHDLSEGGDFTVYETLTDETNIKESLTNNEVIDNVYDLS